MSTLDLTDSELQNAAQAALDARQQALADAANQAGSSTRHIFDASVERYAKLAEKFEQARKQQP